MNDLYCFIYNKFDDLDAFHSDTSERFKSLIGVEITQYVKRIHYDSFSGCYSLYCFDISPTVTIINSYDFCGCSSLFEISIPSSVTAIGKLAVHEFIC